VVIQQKYVFKMMLVIVFGVFVLFTLHNEPSLLLEVRLVKCGHSAEVVCEKWLDTKGVKMKQVLFCIQIF
jgi:hypothetical protein